jgi:hypothetical protein
VKEIDEFAVVENAKAGVVAYNTLKLNDNRIYVANMNIVMLK